MNSAASDPFLLSQILAAISLIIDILVFQFKDRKRVLWLMLISAAFNTIHFLLIGAITAGVIAALVCLRLLTACFLSKRWLAAPYLLIAILLCAKTYAGLPSILALLGTCSGTMAVFEHDNRKMRLTFLLASGFWLIHNILVWSPVAALQEIAISLSNLSTFRRQQNKGPLAEDISAAKGP